MLPVIRQIKELEAKLKVKDVRTGVFIGKVVETLGEQGRSIPAIRLEGTHLLDKEQLISMLKHLEGE